MDEAWATSRRRHPRVERGAGQSVEVRVRQCGEGEGIGWRKVCAQRRRCPANVVDNRGHEGSLFCFAPLRGGCVVDVTNSRFC